MITSYEIVSCFLMIVSFFAQGPSVAQEACTSDCRSLGSALGDPVAPHLPALSIKLSLHLCDGLKTVNEMGFGVTIETNDWACLSVRDFLGWVSLR